MDVFKIMKGQTMRRYIYFSLLLILLSSCGGGMKEAHWMTLDDTDSDKYSILLFRNNLVLKKKPKGDLNFQISAKQRYRLFINGHHVGRGPQTSDPAHWKYDQYEISDFLKAGKNVFAVEVISFGDNSPAAFFSSAPVLWTQSNQLPELNSPGSWLVRRDKSRFPKLVVNGKDVRGGFQAGVSDSLVCDSEINDWREAEYDDKQWEKVKKVGENLGTEFLQQRSIPLMEYREERIGRVVSGMGEAHNFSNQTGNFSLKVEAGKKVRILLDHGKLTTGFPEIRFSGGKGGSIRIGYAESLYNIKQVDSEGKKVPEEQGKGNRNQVKGKEFVGYTDVIIPNGHMDNLFYPSWYRTFRYILLEIETDETPLIIDDFKHWFSAYPFQQKAEFSSSDSSLAEIWEVSRRTSRLCAWETFMDCPYYEQLQYVGDTRIQALVALYQSGDIHLVKNAISQFHNGADKETGLIPSAYPSEHSSVIPSFSLFWTLMVVDYWKYAGDDNFCRNMIPGMKKIIDWHLSFKNTDSGVIEALPNWNFVDWPKEWAWDPAKHTGGIPDGAQEGISSIINLQLVYTILEIADFFEYFGEDEYSESIKNEALKIRNQTEHLCWNSDSGLIADSPSMKSWSQHANSLAVLSGLVPDSVSGDFMERIVFRENLIQTTVYYRFYVNRALQKAGRGDLYLELLTPWKDMLGLGLSTFAEKNDPTRSDCHAWSASPGYDFLSLICGIQPDAPGFKEVLVKPSPGSLEWINAALPHPDGEIKFQYKKQEYYSISFPENVSGRLLLQGKEYVLNSGENRIELN